MDQEKTTYQFKINRKATMKTFKIFALILIMGVSQAGATGFVYNMSKAQKMLKSKKEVVVTRTTRSEVVSKKEERKAASGHGAFMGREPEEGIGEPVSDAMAGTFTQWLSQSLVKLLAASFGM